MRLDEAKQKTSKWSSCAFLFSVLCYSTLTYLKSARKLEPLTAADTKQLVTLISISFIDIGAIILLVTPFIEKWDHISRKTMKILGKIGSVLLACGGIFYITGCILNARAALDNNVNDERSSFNVVWYYILIGQFVGIKSLFVGCCIIFGVFSNKLKVIYLSIDFVTVVCYVVAAYGGADSTLSLAASLLMTLGVIFIFVVIGIINPAGICLCAAVSKARASHKMNLELAVNNGLDNINNDEQGTDTILTRIVKKYKGQLQNRQENMKDKNFYVLCYNVFEGILCLTILFAGGCLLVMHIIIERNINKMFDGQENYILSPLMFGISFFIACILYSIMTFKYSYQIIFGYKNGNGNGKGKENGYNDESYHPVLIDETEVV